MLPSKFDKWIKNNLLDNDILQQLPIFTKIFKKSLFEENSQKRVLIITDMGSPQRRLPPMLAYGYYKAALNLDMQPRIITTKENHKILDIIESIQKKSIIILALSKKLPTGNHGLKSTINKKSHKLLSITGMDVVKTTFFKDFMRMCNADYKKMYNWGNSIKSYLDKGKKVHITTRRGTDITFNINNRKAISNDGYYKNNNGGNMPVGEVYIAPEENKTNGIIIIDGSIRTQDNTYLVKNPIKLIIKNGIIVKCEGGIGADLLNESMEKATTKNFKLNHAKTIGELGIGINPRAKVIGPTILNEKALGTFHIAIGSNISFGGKNKSSIHLDQVILNPTIRIDNKKLEIKKIR